MSQKFVMPKFDIPAVPVIDTSRIPVVTDDPEFQKKMQELRNAAASIPAVPVINTNVPDFTDTPEFQEQLKNIRAATANAQAAAADINRANQAIAERNAAKPKPSQAAQAALGRIRDGFDKIEQISAATRLPALKTQA